MVGQLTADIPRHNSICAESGAVEGGLFIRLGRFELVLQAPLRHHALDIRIIPLYARVTSPWATIAHVRVAAE